MTGVAGEASWAPHQEYDEFEPIMHEALLNKWKYSKSSTSENLGTKL